MAGRTDEPKHDLRRQPLPYGVRVGSISPCAVLNELWGIDAPAEITIRDLVMLPSGQDILDPPLMGQSAFAGAISIDIRRDEAREEMSLN